MRKLLVLASLGVVVALATVAAAQGAIVSKTTFDLTGLTLTNPCNGETVTFTSGTETITLRETDAGSGRVNIGEQITARADGVGATTGAAYRLNENANVTENNVLVTDNGAVVIQASVEFNVIGQGNAPNFREHENIHETITPDGTLTADKFDITSNC
jgi:hypothetical protein